MSAEHVTHILTQGLTHLPQSLGDVLRPNLIKACQIRGDFPTSLGLLDRVKSLLASPDLNPAVLGDCLALDPILAIRLISIVNYSFYARSRAVLTPTGAVNHLGLMRILEVVSDLSNARNFGAIFLGRAVAGSALQYVQLAALLARQIAFALQKTRDAMEVATLTSYLRNAPMLLAAYYRPQLFSAAVLDSIQGKSSLDKHLEKVLGVKPVECGVELTETLALPAEYRQMVATVDIAPWNRRAEARIEGAGDAIAVNAAVYAAQRIATEIWFFHSPLQLETLMKDLAKKLRIGDAALRELVGELPKQYLASCEALGLKALRMPPALFKYATVIVGRDGSQSAREVRWPGVSERINPFLYELRAAFKTRASSDEFPRVGQAVTCTLNALIRGMNFDRACFLTLSSATRSLTRQVLMGHPPPQGFVEVARGLDTEGREFMPDVRCIEEKRPVFHGDPIFRDDWPFVAFPAMSADRVIGVFYADKLQRTDAQPLDTQETLAAVALAEEWRDVPAEFF